MSVPKPIVDSLEALADAGDDVAGLPPIAEGVEPSPEHHTAHANLDHRHYLAKSALASWVDGLHHGTPVRAVEHGDPPATAAPSEASPASAT